MNVQIQNMLADAEGRYLEPTEQSSLIEYASSLELRLAAMRAVQEHEAEILSASVDEMLEALPELPSRHLEVREKSMRDMAFVLRYCTMAMVRDSEEYLTQKLLPWFRTVVVAFEMQDAIETAYGAMLRHAEEHLDPEHHTLLHPYLRLSYDTLTG